MKLIQFIKVHQFIYSQVKKNAESIFLSELEPLIYFCPIKISGSYFPMIDSVPKKIKNISKSKSKMLSAVSAEAGGRGLKETEDESRDLFFCQSRPVQ